MVILIDLFVPPCWVRGRTALRVWRGNTLLPGRTHSANSLQRRCPVILSEPCRICLLLVNIWLALSIFTGIFWWTLRCGTFLPRGWWRITGKQRPCRSPECVIPGAASAPLPPPPHRGLSFTAGRGGGANTIPCGSSKGPGNTASSPTTEMGSCVYKNNG